MKRHEWGMICGRFQHFHEGHEILVDTALALCDKVIIFIGSAQESGTLRNPFSWQTRYSAIRKIYPNRDKVFICPLDDLTSEDDITPKWGSYLLDKCIEEIGRKPNLMVYGNDESRSLWFDKKDLQGMSEIIVNRYGEVDISATKLREMLAHDDRENWEKHTHSNIHNMYLKLRRELMECEEYKPKVHSLGDILQMGLKMNMSGRVYRGGSTSMKWKIENKRMYTYNKKIEEWVRPSITSHWTENDFIVDESKEIK